MEHRAVQSLLFGSVAVCWSMEQYRDGIGFSVRVMHLIFRLANVLTKKHGKM